MRDSTKEKNFILAGSRNSRRRNCFRFPPKCNISATGYRRGLFGFLRPTTDRRRHRGSSPTGRTGTGVAARASGSSGPVPVHCGGGRAPGRRGSGRAGTRVRGAGGRELGRDVPSPTPREGSSVTRAVGVGRVPSRAWRGPQGRGSRTGLPTWRSRPYPSPWPLCLRPYPSRRGTA